MIQVNGLASNGRVTSPNLLLFCNGVYSVSRDPLTAAPAALTYSASVISPPAAGSYPVMWPYKPDGDSNGRAFAYTAGAEVPLFIYCNTTGTVTRIDSAGIPGDTGWPVAVGTPPPNPICGCVWQDRLCVSDGLNFYMSRAQIHNDWDYTFTDNAAPISGNSLTGATLADAIVAMVPFGNDSMLVFGHRSIYRFVGNPREGGRLENVSRNVGILGPAAWDYDPTGAVWFADQTGLWVITADGKLTPISRDRVFSPFSQIVPDDYRVSVVWHEPWRSAMVFLSPLTSDSAIHLHHYPPTEWFGLNGFADNAIGPLSACSFKSATSRAKDLILMGGRDSKVRYWDLGAAQDDGTDFEAFCFIGPYELAGPGKQAIVKSIDATLGVTPLGLQTGADWQMTARIYQASDPYSAGIGALAEQVKSFTSYTGYGIQDRQACRLSAQTMLVRIDNKDVNGTLGSKKFWSVERMYVMVGVAGQQDGENI